MWYTPLEQFKIVVVQPLSFLGLDISITNSTVYLLLATMFVYIIFKRGTKLGRLVPDGMQRLAELMYMFVNNLVKQQAGIKGLRFFPLLLVLFYMILFLNLIGLTPFGFTCTSQICYTFTLGFSFFIGIVIIGIVAKKMDFLKQFVPDVKGPILPIIVVIEIFSFLIRPVSLSVRLFANMLAGHSLLHILASFGMSMLKTDVLVALLMAGPIVAVCVLELGIAFIQAYVFIVLLCIYMRESYYGH
jgi:F-type H+-transporting ATPase subunit a